MCKVSMLPLSSLVSPAVCLLLLLLLLLTIHSMVRPVVSAFVHNILSVVIGDFI